MRAIALAERREKLQERYRFDNILNKDMIALQQLLAKEEAEAIATQAELAQQAELNSFFSRFLVSFN